MSFKKYANAIMSDPILKPNDWDKMWGRNAFKGCRIDSNHPFCKTAADQSKYLLSHCTILASVMTEPEPDDFLIKPECSGNVNNNDDAWENSVVRLSHKSFIGAFNFVEHFQNSKFAKGHLLDSVLRKINVGDGGTWVYYVDILVATDLKHEKLIEDIRSDKVRYLSMGCVTDLVICSFCGAHVTDASTYCHHLQFQKGTFLADNDGIPRRIAELCGHKSMSNGGVKFVEASWVGTPAFPGAAKRNIIADEWLGPKTPYTSKAAASTFAKEASLKLDLGEMLLGKDIEGDLLR